MTPVAEMQLRANLRRLRELASEYESLTADRLRSSRLRTVIADMESWLAAPRRASMAGEQ